MNKIILALSLTLLFSVCEAKTLYVDIGDGSCSDSTTYANNTSSAPWCNVYRAAWGSTSYGSQNTSEAAQAGDTVIVAPGTYPVASNSSKYIPVLTPANSGTAGNLITFRAEYPAASSDSGNWSELTFSSGSGAMAGAYQREYIVWDGFRIDEASAPSTSDTGQFVYWDSDNSRVTNMSLEGSDPLARDDNFCGIRVEESTLITVDNNHIYNYTTSNNHGAGVLGYSAQNITVRNNLIENINDGIHAKGTVNLDQRDWSIYKNWIETVDNGIILGDSDGSSVYQNIIIGNVDAGIRIISFSSGTPSDLTIYNNTIYDGARGFFNYVGDGQSHPVEDNVIRDNIVSNVDYGTRVEVTTTSDFYYSTGKYLFSYNFYDDITTAVARDDYSTGNMTLAQWKSSPYSQDTGALETSAGFTDEGNQDFTLAVGSSALTASSTSGPVGAYITGLECIGLEDSCETTADSGLSIKASGTAIGIGTSGTAVIISN